MKLLFWTSTMAVAYTYFGYVAFLWIKSRLRPRPTRKSAIEPTVSVIMVVHNEEARILNKLHNLIALDYPKEKMGLVIISDASTDRTDKLIATAQELRCFRTKHLHCRIRGGKAAALADAIAVANGEILFFTDARQMIEPGALRELVANFADPSVGCVSGELMLAPCTMSGIEGVSIYWRFEKFVRKLEALVGSNVGATGAIYAARRASVVPPPPGTLLDDVYIPVHIARQGLRVVFESGARAWDNPANEKQEFCRKVRTLAGNYQLLQAAPWLLSQVNPIRWTYFNHKLLRLLVPFLLLSAILANIALISTPFYFVLLALQVCSYTAGVLGLLLPRRVTPRLFAAASGFLLLNAAAIVAPLEYLLHRRDLSSLWRSAAPNSSIDSVTGGLIDGLPVKH